MIQKIPKEFISSLLDKTNIVFLIKDRLQLLKKGNRYVAKCPFHYENTPSFVVNEEKQFYYCFGCHEHGNVIDFLMSFEKKNFLDVIYELAGINNIEVPYLKSSIQQCSKRDLIRSNLYYVMNSVVKEYQLNLFRSSNKLAINYLKKRGLNEETINNFSLGYSNLISYKILKNSNKESTLLNLGIFYKNHRYKCYERFINRVIFPLRNDKGKIVGIGSRSINNVSPKYLNSPETEIFKKREYIYGLYEACLKNPSPPYLLVVEGYIDVLTLIQHKVNCVVGLLGTSITKEHIRLLFNKTNTIIYCYDGDKAGRIASWRTLKSSLHFLNDKRNIKFMFIPREEDPDSLINREGKRIFLERIKTAVSISDFFLYKLLHKNVLKDISDKVDIIRRASPLINEITGSLTRSLIKNKLFKILGLKTVENSFLFLKAKKVVHKDPLSIFYNKNFIVRVLIVLLIQDPNLVTIIPNINSIKILKTEKVAFFLELIKNCIQYKNMNTAKLTELYRGTYKFKLVKRFANVNLMVERSEKSEFFLDFLVKIYDKILEKKYLCLIIKEKTIGLDYIEKNMLWNISKALSKY